MKVVGLAAIDVRTAAAQGLLAWRSELVAALGGVGSRLPGTVTHEADPRILRDVACDRYQPRAIDAYIESRLEADYAEATINREPQLLGQAMRLAMERHRITTIPSIRHLPEQNARQGFFERPEFEAAVTALPAYLRDFARFGYLTGWRRGEIGSLTWTDVDHDGGASRLRPEHSKNGRGRVVPFDVVPQLAALMKRRLQARLFTDHDGRPRVDEADLRAAMRKVGQYVETLPTIRDPSARAGTRRVGGELTVLTMLARSRTDALGAAFPLASRSSAA